VIQEFNIDCLRRLAELAGLCEATDYVKWRLALLANTT
jgi:hypothetical protein